MKERLKTFTKKIIKRVIYSVVMDILLFDIRFFVDPKKVILAKTASISNALLNTNSGTITIGEYTFFGQNVTVIAGTHDHTLFGKDRMHSIPQTGQDVVIGNGVWVGSNAIIVGPCIIGDNAVISAGAVVMKDVDANTIVSGNPARPISVLLNSLDGVIS
jgi:acetyltransferase-like isoleucine patch superfamily enzyme